MPSDQQRLLATYLMQYLGRAAQVTYTDRSETAIPSSEGYITFIYGSETDADRAMHVIQQLINSVRNDINAAQSEPEPIVRTPISIGIPQQQLKIKFLKDLKALVVAVLSSRGAENYYPADYDEDNYRFCEPLFNTFVIPSMHKSLLRDMEIKFLTKGIRLETADDKYASVFRSPADFSNKKITLSLASIDVSKLVMAARLLNGTPKPLFVAKRESISTLFRLHSMAPRRPQTPRAADGKPAWKS